MISTNIDVPDHVSCSDALQWFQDSEKPFLEGYQGIKVDSWEYNYSDHTVTIWYNVELTGFVKSNPKTAGDVIREEFMKMPKHFTTSESNGWAKDYHEHYSDKRSVENEYELNALFLNHETEVKKEDYKRAGQVWSTLNRKVIELVEITEIHTVLND